MDSFGRLLKTFREQAGLTQRGLARASGVNSAIVSRLESDDRAPSGPAQVLALARALRLAPAETDRLLAAAGLWPQVFLAVGPDDPSLLAVARLLASERVDGRAKACLRRVIDDLAGYWLAEPAEERA